MRLEIAEFPVSRVRIGAAYRYQEGALEVDGGEGSAHLSAPVDQGLRQARHHPGLRERRRPPLAAASRVGHGEQAGLEIQHLVHVLDFWDYKRQKPADTNTVIAWTGESPAAGKRGMGVRLCRTTFENPQPRKPVATLDYVSAMAGSAPFLVAVTVE